MLRSLTRAGRTSDPFSAWAVATNEYLGALRGCAHINCLAKGSSESTSNVTGKQLRARAGVPRPSGAPFASRSDFGLSAGGHEEALWRVCPFGAPSPTLAGRPPVFSCNSFTFASRD